MQSGYPPEPEHFLQHAASMRALARYLVRDDARVDDVIQETWLAALVRPPAEHGSLRGWLHRVLRSLAFRTLRDERRRRRREQTAARSERADLDPETVVERAELHQSLGALVLALEEPYRSTVILRFFEDLGPRQIARRQGIPESTVKSRLARALEMLRSRLDRLHGGDRNAWKTAILPLSALPLAKTSPSRLPDVALKATAIGHFFMTQKLASLLTTGVVGAVSLVTGIGLGYHSAAQAPENPVVARAPAPAESSGLSGEGTPGASRRDSSPADPSPRPSDRDLERAVLSAVPDPDWIPSSMAPTKAIQGSVRIDGTGEPLPGVLLRAVPRRIPEAFRPPSPPTSGAIMDRIVRFVQEERASTMAGVEGMTDDRGFFTLHDTAEGALYMVTAWKEGWRIDIVDDVPSLDVEHVKAGETVRFQAHRVVAVPFDVRFADGTVPSVARVKSNPRGRGRYTHHSWYPSAPFVQLPVGEHRLKVFYGVDRNAVSEPFIVNVVPGAIREPISVVLSPRDGIRGQVIIEDGLGPPAVFVYIASIAGSDQALDDDFLATGERIAVEGPQYRFDFKDIAPGSYLIGVGRFVGEILSTETVEVTNGFTDQDLVLPPLDRSDYVVVRPLDPDGNPITNARISILGPGRRGGASVRQPDGSFHVAFPPANDGGGIDGPFQLTVDSAQYGTEVIELTRGDAEVTVRFEPGADLLVVLDGYTGSPVQGLLTLRLLATDPRRSEQDVSISWKSHEGNPLRPDGTQEFGPVRPGSYRLVVDLGGHGMPPETLASRDVELVAGDNELVFELPAFHSLEVFAPDAGDGRSIVLVGLGEKRVSYLGRLDAEKRATFQAVPQGDYVLALSGSGSMRVTLMSDLALEFHADIPDAALAVSVHRSGGALQEAGLHDGDLIVAIAGHSLDRVRSLPDLALLGGELELTVVRGSSSFVAAVEAARLLDPESAGGSLERVTPASLRDGLRR